MTDEDEQAPARAPAWKFWGLRMAFVVALVLLVLALLNASWLADAPRGYVQLIAHRGTAQQFDHAGLTDKDCTATRIEPPVHEWLEDTTEGLAEAVRLGAQMVQIDVAPTRDGQIVLFHDWTLDCRTDGKGPLRDRTLAELKALDVGYGYTADGGKTFPFRGKGVGQMPTLAEGLAMLPGTPALYNLKSKDPAEADLLIAALKAAGRDVQGRHDGFQGSPEQVARFHAAFPGAWAFSGDAASRCTRDYLKLGWFTVTPESCRGGTLMVPLNSQWAFAGWPNLTQQRMAAVGARIVVTGAYGSDHAGMGLDLPEQLGEVPDTFTGYLWVDDIYTVGPALRPAYNKRRPPEEAALEKAVEARRKARD